MSSNPGAGEFVFTVAMFAVCMICLFGGRSKGYADGRKSVQIEAVERGLAEWAPDVRGETTFRWLSEKKDGQ